MSSPTTSAAWTIPSHASDVKHLNKKDISLPALGDKQVLIKITAVSLNFRDVLISTRSPAYPGVHKEDLVPGSDGAGIIISAGSNSKWAGKEGTSVVLHPSTWLNGDIRNLHGDQVFGGSSVDGTLQTYRVTDDEQIIEAPKGWTGTEIAGLLTAGGTAWAAIRGSLDARLDGEVEAYKGSWTERRLEGKWVLTQGTGGVSCAAIQIASALGARVIATSSSDAKLDFAKKLGAKHVVNYKKTPSWEEEVLRITEGKGVDHVIEVGGATTIMQSVAATRPGGLISVIGILTQAESIPAAFVPAVLFGAKIVKGCTAFSRDTSAEFVKFAEANNLKPVIAKTFGFGEVVEAFQELQKQNAVGKLVVKISGK
ncbi:hypothetical protein BDV96DRAFT_645064 [Lophiotrema nucula]|uniref:Enoyl reductase (ER) domain-containing protein n=1 Tax=Lophiotrema nucula TaxID=690887 RepID=A0A6A5ZBM9_9PLEO|nr:hypothetical protein BDV96DRAFT_645064 [Lophiotrema nucula]